MDKNLEKFSNVLQEQIMEQTSTAPHWQQRRCGVLWLIISVRRVHLGRNITGSLNLNSSDQIVIGVKNERMPRKTQSPEMQLHMGALQPKGDLL